MIQSTWRLSYYIIVVENSKACGVFRMVHILINHYSFIVYFSFFHSSPQITMFGDLTLNQRLMAYDVLGKGNIERIKKNLNKKGSQNR